MNYGVVYLARNRINGKCYVGQTTQDSEVRFHQHRTRRNSRCRAFAAALAKHGADVFEFSVLMKAATRSDLDQAEIRFIGEFNSMAPNGYNVRAGGSAGTHTEATRLKISAGNKGKKQSVQQRAAASERMRGTSLSAVSRAKISATLKGRSLPSETCEKMSLARMGRKHHAASRQKMSANRSGIAVSEAHKAKLRVANLGKSHSPETKARMSSAQRDRWARRRVPQ